MTIRRVLHLITPSAPGCGASMLRLLGFTRRVTPEFDHRVLVLGPASATEQAVEAGVGAHRRLPPLFGAPRLSARSIRRAIAAEDAALVHVWDAESCAIVAASHPREALAATIGAVPPRAKPTPLAQDRAEAICLGERARRQAIAAGWLHARIHTTLPPTESAFQAHARSQTSIASAADSGSAFPLDEPPFDLEQRQRLRAEWGVDDATVVIGVTGDPWSAIDGTLAFDMAGRAWFAGHHVHLVIDPRVVAAAGLRHWSECIGLRQILIETPLAGRPWEIYSGLDAMLLPESTVVHARRRNAMFDRPPRGGPSGPLGILWAIDAGLPAILTRDGPLDGLADPSLFTIVQANPNMGASVLRLLRVRSMGPSSTSTRPAGESPGRDSALSRSPRSAEAWADAIRSLYGRAAVAAGLPRAADMTVVAAS